jgi:hypothetical protein
VRRFGNLIKQTLRLIKLPWTPLRTNLPQDPSAVNFEAPDDPPSGNATQAGMVTGTKNLAIGKTGPIDTPVEFHSSECIFFCSVCPGRCLCNKTPSTPHLTEYVINNSKTSQGQLFFPNMVLYLLIFMATITLRTDRSSIFWSARFSDPP